MKKNTFNLSKEKRDAMIVSIRSYFLKERDEDLGELAASMILDFFIKELAAEFYNQGIEDSYRYMADRIEDMLGLQR